MVKDIWKKIKDPKSNFTFVIAEAGVNHNGDIRLAKKLVDVAASAGADAVKFQMFKAGRLVTEKAPKAAYQKKNTAQNESQFEMLRRLELSPEEYRNLYCYCRQEGIIFMSTPFDEDSADFLEDLGMEFFKMPSGEITNLPFLSHVASKKKPIIVSTGMSSLKEVGRAVGIIRKANNHRLALLHCVSCYPADCADVNLKAMETMRGTFKLPVGYSDHTLGIEIAIAAVAMGARIIEKHFTLDKTLPGPDHKASLEPGSLKEMVRCIRNVEKSKGSGIKEGVLGEADTAAITRKSLIAACSIPKGTRISEEMITIKRPGTGLPPAMKHSLIGKRAKVNIKYDDILLKKMFL